MEGLLSTGPTLPLPCYKFQILTELFHWEAKFRQSWLKWFRCDLDDTKIKKNIKSEEDVELLQQELDKLYCWGGGNMQFNNKKFLVLRYSAYLSFTGRNLVFYRKL